MRVQPYVFFDGRCEEAITFYKKALGAELVSLKRFSENPDLNDENCQGMAEGFEDKVMHADIRIGDTNVLVSDGRCTGKPTFDGFSLTLSVKDDAQAERSFAALSEGGETLMPLAKTFWASKFGMVNDRFGVSWMVMTISD